MLMAETKAPVAGQAALGTPLACPRPLPRIHLGVEWDVPVYPGPALGAPGPWYLAQRGKRSRQLTRGQEFWS